MANVRTCTKPDEAWALVHHFLGNLLSPISIMIGKIAEENDDEKRGRLEDDILRTRSRLIGSLYELARRMDEHGHREEGGKIQQLVEMVLISAFTNLAECQNIFDKQDELDHTSRVFAERLTELQEQHERP